MLNAREPLWDVVEESFDEAEFLWRSWESGLDGHGRNLRETWFWTEDRLQGALDGVRLGRLRIIEERLRPALSRNDGHGFTVAAHVLASLAQPGREALEDALRGCETAQRQRLRRALELLAAPSQGCHEIDVWLRQQGELALKVAARTFRRQRSGDEEIASLLAAPEAESRLVAVQAARFLPLARASKLIEAGLQDADPHVREAAVEAGLVHGLPAAWRACRELVAKKGSANAHHFLACLGGAEAESILVAALGDGDRSAHALAALGFLGTREAADVALEAMQAQSEINLRLAAEAFCAVTGLDLQRTGLVVPEPALPDEPLPFELDDLSADLVPTPDALLPLPDVRGVAHWWQGHRERFEAGQRYIGGAPLAPRALHDALVGGPMRRRHVLAFELAARTAGACDVQTRAFHAFQKRQLAEVATTLSQPAVLFHRAPLAM